VTVRSRTKKKSPLSPPRQPAQERGRQSIRDILDAAHRVLRREGPARITTPAIAAEAGLSIGALYHYFPNKESVILALYETKLADIGAIVEEPIPAVGGDWRTGVRGWIHRIKAHEAALDYDIAMNEAMDHFPSLREVSRRHLSRQAVTIAGQLKRLGSRWPDEALFDLALYAVFLNSSLWLYWAYADTPLPQGVDRLADTLVALFSPALEGAAAPGEPLAKPLPQA